MTSGGLGDISYGQDAVAAKLSLDIPAGSEAVLKEISRYTGDLSANMQAAARFTGEYMSYLQSFPAIQRQVIDLQREQLGILQQTATAMGAIHGAQSGFVSAGFGGGYGGGYGGGREVQGGAYNAQRLPPGYERFGGTGAVPAQPGNNGNGGNSNSNYQDELTRQGTVRDRVREREQQDRQEEQHRRRNGGTGGRHSRPDDDDEDPEVDDHGRRTSRRIRAGGQGAAGGINDIGSLFTPGGSNGGRMMSIARLMGTAANAEGEGGTGLAGLLGKLPGSTPGAGLLGGLPMWAKGAGLAGAGIAAGTMAFNAAQDVGEGVQNLRNQDPSGQHSLSGGLGVEKDVRLMALNPLLTNDQSRDIIMGALKSGHSGESYDSAVDFIKKNLTDMNIGVADSVGVLKSNVDLGKQSIESLKFDMAQNYALAAATGKSPDQLNQEFLHIDKAATGQGIDATAASHMARQAGAMFANDPLGMSVDGGKTDSPFSTLIASIMNAGDSSPIKSMVHKKFAPNSPFTLTYQKTGVDTYKDIWEVLKEQARTMNPTAWIAYAAQTGISAGLQDAPNTFQNTMDFWNKANDKNLDPVANAAAINAANDSIKVAGKDASTLPGFDAWQKQPGNAGKTKSDYNAAISGGAIEPLKVDSNMLKNLAMTHPRAVVVDPSGKKYLIDATNPDQATGIGNGTWKVYDNVLDKDTKHNDDGSLSNGTMSRGEGSDSTNKDLSRGLSGLDLSSKQPLAADQGVNLPSPAVPAAPATPPPGLRSTGHNSFNMNPPMAPSDPTHIVGLTPEASKLLTLHTFPGNVPTDQNTLDSNSGANSATRNGLAPR